MMPPSQMLLPRLALAPGKFMSHTITRGQETKEEEEEEDIDPFLVHQEMVMRRAVMFYPGV